jgi:SAM-dependent methyltransferase
MSWDPVWEQIFRTRDWGRYPPEELIRFIARYFFAVPDRKQIKILELGCGTGANLWFLSREGFDPYGIDGSETAIAKAHQRLQAEGMTAHLQVGDIIALDDFYSPASFDAVIDVACLWCNRLGDVHSIVDKTLALLKPQGRIFSMTLAAGTYGDGLGTQVEPGTFLDIREGPLHGTGLNHFFTLEEVEQVFERFSNVGIEYSIRSLDNRQHVFKHWVTEGIKG